VTLRMILLFPDTGSGTSGGKQQGKKKKRKIIMMNELINKMSSANINLINYCQAYFFFELCNKLQLLVEEEEL